jgi:hypothetical protein
VLAVAALQFRVAADVDELELEIHVLTHIAHDLERPLAEPAVGRVIERDLLRYGYRPRVVVASATRCTASPYDAIRRLVS